MVDERARYYHDYHDYHGIIMTFSQLPDQVAAAVRYKDIKVSSVQREGWLHVLPDEMK